MSQASDVLFGRAGEWTEQEYRSLPENDARIELLDGSLLVTPAPSSGHQRLSYLLCRALDDAAPSGLEVLEAVGVRVAPGQILIPDLVVVTRPGLDTAFWEPTDVAMVIEIVSPGSVARDRAIKPVLYAVAGIPNYLRIEQTPTGPRTVVHRLDGDRYRAVRTVEADENLVLTDPFQVTVEPSALVRRR